MHHKTKRQIFKDTKVFKDKNVIFVKSRWQLDMQLKDISVIRTHWKLNV